jgi:hypothetical protein
MKLVFFSRVAFTACLAIMGIGGSFAASINIIIENDDPNDAYVSVRDLNTAGHDPVLTNARINSHDGVPISVTADGSGHGHVSWIATRTDEPPSACGSGDAPDLDNLGRPVSVSMSGSCPPSTQLQTASTQLSDFIFKNSTSIEITVTLQTTSHSQGIKTYKVGPDKTAEFHPNIKDVGSLTISVDDGSHDKISQTVRVSGQPIPQYISVVRAEYNVGSIKAEVRSICPTEGLRSKRLDRGN